MYFMMPHSVVFDFSIVLMHDLYRLVCFFFNSIGVALEQAVFIGDFAFSLSECMESHFNDEHGWKIYSGDWDSSCVDGKS